MPRAFVALDLPEAALDRLEGAVRGLPVGRVVPRENLHLTLAFLDEQSMSLLEALHEHLADIRQPPFELVVQALDIWGSSHPRVLVARVANCAPLDHLQTAVAHAARAAGLELPRRRFRPHVTLARFPDLSAAADARLRAWIGERGALPGFSFEVESFTLYRSTLRRDGAIHEPLATYELA